MNYRQIKYKNDFLQSIGDRKVICFGAGKAFKNIIPFFDECGIINQIMFVVDNNKELWGQEITLTNNHNVKIVGPQFVIDNANAYEAIIVTNSRNKEIYKQLECLISEQIKDLYKYEDIRNAFYIERMNNAEIPQSFIHSNTQLIPKKIHYCWFGKQPIPDQYKKWMESWKLFCPDYEIIEWNEINYDYKKNNYMKEAYEAKKWGFVSDYARLDIIYENGGIYLDTDVELVRSLDELLYEDGFGGFQPDGRFATGLGFGSIKKNEVMKGFLDAYEDLKFEDFITIDERFKKKIRTTPDILTKYLEEKGYYFENSTMNIKGFYIYPAPVLCGVSDKNSECFITDKTFSIHHFSGSWMPNK